MTDNIVMIKNTPVAGRRPTGGRQGELYFNFADRVIGCMDGAGMPIDIASAIPVGDTEPVNAVPGMLWLDTGSSPATLLVFMGTGLPEPWIPVTASFVIATEEQALEGENNEVGMTPLRVRQAIEAMSSSVSVGDTAPAGPRPGELWFKTAAPVGLFIWYQDADSSQWVQVGGGGGPEFASIAEARAGSITDKVMSPALVGARSGAQAFNVAGLTTVTFNNVPVEANEIDLMLNGVSSPGNAVPQFDFAGAPAARAFSTRAGLTNASPVGAAGDDNNTIFVLDFIAAASTLTGCVHLRRGGGPGASWYVSGSLRRSPTQLLLYSGVFNMNGELNAFLRFSSNLAFIGGGATAKWRI